MEGKTDIADQFRRVVKEAFRNFYPCLQIGFKEDESVAHAVERESLLLFDSSSMEEASVFLLRKIEISDEMTVDDFRQKMEDSFHEEVHVFRRFYNIWINIGLTSHWTLRQQNENGLEL